MWFTWDNNRKYIKKKNGSAGRTTEQNIWSEQSAMNWRLPNIITRIFIKTSTYIPIDN